MPQALCSSDSWNEIKYMFILIAIIIFIRMTARPCICLLSHVILSWSHGEKHAIKERNGMLSSSFCLFWKLNDAVISMPCIFFSFYSLGVLMMRAIRRSSNQCTSEQSQCVTSPLGQQPTPGHAQTPTRHKHSPPQSTPGTHVMLKHPISLPQSPHMPQPRSCGDSCKHEVSLCCSYKPLSISHPLHLSGKPSLDLGLYRAPRAPS